MGTAFLKPMFGDFAQLLAVRVGAASLTVRADATAGRARAAAGSATDAAGARGTAVPAVEAAGDLVTGAQPAPGCSEAKSPRRAALARRAQDYLEANLDQPFSLRELSEMARCSERMLQYAFRDVYGMGPHAWFQAMKLTEANRELRTPGSGDVRVSDVALRWGFTHFGRFSLEYRRMFGESPSETLKRGSRGGSTWQQPMVEKTYRAAEQQRV